MMQWSTDAPSLILFGLLTAVLVTAAVQDYRTGRIANVLTLGAVAAGLLTHAGIGLVTGGLAGMGSQVGASLLGLAVAFVPFAVIYFAGGLGGGDVKLMAAAGAIGGSWPFVLSTAFYAILLAALMAIGMMIRHRIVGRTVQRLFGALLLFASRVRPTLPDDSPRVPFGVAICLGGLLAGVEHLLHVPLPWTA